MRRYIKGLCFAFLIAFASVPATAGELPYFPAGEWPQTPAVPPPSVSSGSVVPVPELSALPAYAFSGKADIEGLIESAVRASTSSVEVAIYGFTLPRVAQALADAKARGVRVRVIMNESHLFTPRRSEQIQQLLDAGVEMRSLRGVGRYGIMHNKLGIYDGKVVSAGSFNWAVTANEANSENAVFIADPEVTASYRAYFEWMWGLARPSAEGPAEPVAAYPPPPACGARPLDFNGALLPRCTFSPGGDTEKDIAAALDFARETADIAVFSFYSQTIADAVLNAHKRGVKVRVLTDRVQASQSDVGKLFMDAGVPFRWSQGFAGKGVMHNKFAVLDGKLLMTGSFNWSVNAQQNNFENEYYSADPALAAAFAAQFGDLFDAAETPTPEDLAKARREALRLSGR